MGFTSTIRCALRAAAVCCILTACAVTRGYAQQQPSTLPNGLTVVVSPRPGVAIVAIDFWVKAGSASELPGEYGAAHYLEHTLFKGTLHKSGQAADYAVELAGGQLNASTGADYAHYYTEVPSEGFDAALNTIAEIIRNPAFPEKEVVRERDVILDELSKRGADQAGRLTDRLYEQAFPGAPYGRSAGGTPLTIKARGRDTLAAYCAREYVPENCILSVAGDVLPQQALNSARRCFEDWKPEAQAPPQKQTSNAQAAPSSKIPSYPGEMPGVAIAFFAPKASDTKNVSCALAVAALLGGEQAGGRFSTARWDGTHASVTYVPRRDVSLLVITAHLPRAVPPRPFEAPLPTAFRSQEELLAAIQKEVYSLSESTVNGAEVRAAGRMVQGEYAFDMETCAGLARSVGRALAIGQDGPTQMIEAVGRLTSADIVQFSRQWLARGKEFHAVTDSGEKQ